MVGIWRVSNSATLTMMGTVKKGEIWEQLILGTQRGIERVERKGLGPGGTQQKQTYGRC